MTSYIHRSALTMLLLLCVAQSARAGVVVEFVPSTTDVFLTGGTQSFSIDVQISADNENSGMQSFAGYGIPIDFALAGRPGSAEWLECDFGFAAIRFSHERYFLSDTSPTTGDYDLLVQGLTLPGGGINLTTTPVSLFRFTVELSSQAVPGVFTASILSMSPDKFYSDGNFEDISPVNDRGVATINVAVPEPSGLFSIGLLGMPWLVGRRRRVG